MKSIQETNLMEHNVCFCDFQRETKLISDLITAIITITWNRTKSN